MSSKVARSSSSDDGGLSPFSPGERE